MPVTHGWIWKSNIVDIIFGEAVETSYIVSSNRVRDVEEARRLGPFVVLRMAV